MIPSELTDTSVTLVVSGYPAYAAAKAGIQGMSRNLALDYAASKIRVNVVSPGAVDTNMSGNSRALEPGPALVPCTKRSELVFLPSEVSLTAA